MKRIIILALSLFVANFAHAQFTVSGSNLYHTGGNVGIGITNPSHKLSVGISNSDVSSNFPAIIKERIGIVNANSAATTYLMSSGSGSTSKNGINAYDWGNNTYLPLDIGWGANNIRIAQDGGKVGIGVTEPSHQLSIGTSNSNVSSSFPAIIKERIGIVNANSAATTYLLSSGSGSTSKNGINAYDWGNNTYLPLDIGWGANNIRIAQDGGKVGIGVTEPSHQLSIGTSNSNVSSNFPAIIKERVGIVNANSSATTYLLSAGSGSNQTNGINVYDYANGTYLPLDIGWGGNDVRLAKDGGKVGIGITDPSHQLSIGTSNSNVSSSFPAIIKERVGIVNANSSATTYLLSAGSGSNQTNGINVYDYANGTYLPLDIGWGGNDVRLAKEGGNVGIGTLTPGYTLDVNGTINASQILVNGQPISSSGGGTSVWSISGTAVNYQAGNVGIGTTTPGDKLEVNGTIRSKKVKVEASGWPDYVFSDNYELLDLSAVQAFIKKEGHLPEVPSADEIETKGLDLGSMDATLLKKVEELTLYVIALEAGREKLAEENKELKSLFSELKKEIELLKEGK